jgi:O-antigen ligase
LSALGLPYLKLPGMLENPQALYGIIRSGTFLEGNFFGLFLILSAAIAFYLKKEKSGWYLLLSVLTSLSSISIISSIVFVIIYYKSKIFQKKYLNYLLIFLPALLLGIFLLMQSTFYQNYVYKKIATPSNIITTYNFSKVDRLLTSRIAYNIGVNNPILGVGPYNYGLHYDQYNDINQKVDNLKKSEFATNYFNRINVRAIPNNVYLEIWSEYGILSFLVYLMFLINLLYTLFKLKEPAILGGFVALLLSFNAFPSFIMLFLWVYLAIPYALLYNKKLQEANLIIVDEN